MRVVNSVIATNEVITLADGTREVLTDCALEDGARQINEGDGLPRLMEHDWLRPCGWTHRAWTERDGYHLRLVFEDIIPETAEDFRVILWRYAKYLSTISEQRTAPFQELARSLNLPDVRLTWDTDCVYLQAPGLAARLCPSVFARTDEDGLIRLGNGVVHENGWLRNDAYLLVPSRLMRPGFDLPNAPNRDFLSSLLRLAKGSTDCEVRLSLDRDRLGIPASLQPMERRELWWGPPYRGNSLKQPDGVTVHGPTRYDSLNGLIRTEFWWYGKAERTLEIEELVDLVRLSGAHQPSRRMRFIHSIFNHGGTPRHLDGAIRTYTDDLWVVRTRPNSNISNFGKKAQRAKLWRVDGSLSLSTWYELIHMFFRGNYTVGEYFGFDPEVFWSELKQK